MTKALQRHFCMESDLCWGRNQFFTVKLAKTLDHGMDYLIVWASPAGRPP